MEAFNYYKYCNNGKQGFLPMLSYTDSDIVENYRGVIIVEKYIRVADVFNYYYIYDGVIVSELTGSSKARIDQFFDGVVDSVGHNYHHHDRPQKALTEARQILASADRHNKQLNKLFS